MRVVGCIIFKDEMNDIFYVFFRTGKLEFFSPVEKFLVDLFLAINVKKVILNAERMWLPFAVCFILSVLGKEGHFSCVCKLGIFNFLCVWEWLFVFTYSTKGLLDVFLSWARTLTAHNHTYLARETPWSSRRFSVGEAFPLHFGRVDPADNLKCRLLECVISWWGGLRSRYPLLKHNIWYTVSHPIES